MTPKRPHVVKALIALLALLAFISSASALPRSQRARSTKPNTTAAAASAPSPHDVLGFSPGDDRKLASWAQIVDYFSRLAKASDRVMLQEIGKTTLGRPLVFAAISSPRNLAQLDRYKTIQQKLADPRTIKSDDAQAEKLITEGRAIVLITCGIHSTEVGGPLVSMNIAYKLASDESSDTREILDRCIILLVPSLNPDGVDIVKNWYDKTLGTPAEGTSPPELYHHYVGHDNNRDWYAFTQVETQLVVDKIHNVWHPQIVHDIHQQGETGSRFFIPPYLDPWEPNVPPIIQAGVNFMGSSMAWELAGEGKAGVVINGVYDAWTPARAYQHYHGGIRILSETASARLASPTNVAFDRLTPQIGVNTKLRSWNFPIVWPGGEWKLANIVDYMQSGAFALMKNAARYRERWLRDFYLVGKDAVRKPKPGEPFAFLIPPVKGAADYGYATRWRVDGLKRLVSILERGKIEILDAASQFEAGGKQFPAGTKVILTAQPYGAFARTLLEPQHYPDLREYPGGPPRRPYDVTAHTLPLLMGVDVVKIEKPFTLPDDRRPGNSNTEGVERAGEVRVGLYKSYSPSMDEGWTRWILDQYKDAAQLGFKLSYSSVMDADIRTGNLELKLVAKGTQVPYLTREQAQAAARSLAPGGDEYTTEWETAPYRERADAGGLINQGWVVVSKNPVITGLGFRNVSARPSEYVGSAYDIAFSLVPDSASRLADATRRHIGDHLAIVINNEVKSAPSIQSQINDKGQITGNFTKKSAEDLARTLGELRARFDCIIIPAQDSRQIVNGLSKDRYPVEISGGLGKEGVESLKKFVEDGGTLITLNQASQFAISELKVPVRNALEGVPSREFYCPGSILKIKFDPSSPITRGAPTLDSSTDESIAWVEGAIALEPTAHNARVIARFADAKELLLSGWLLGADRLAGKGAIVDVKQGKGRIVMFAFRPQYRGQSIATLPFLFNAISQSK